MGFGNLFILNRYAALLNDLQQLLLNTRQAELKTQVNETIGKYSANSQLGDLIRASCTYVMMICLREHKLFSEFFDLDLVLRTSLMKTTLVMHKTSLNKQHRKSTLSNTNTTNSSSGNTSGNSRATTPLTPQTPIGYAPLFPLNSKHNRMIGGAQSDRDGVTLGGNGSDSNDDGGNDDDDDDDISGDKRISSLLDDLCHLLYSHLRPFVIHESKMDSLCDVVHIVEQEIRESIEFQNYSGNIACFEKTVVRIIEDAQERLVYRTVMYTRIVFNVFII